MIYKATVNVLGRGQFFYIGQTSTTFKARLGNHLRDFKLESRRKNTELSKFIWRLKGEMVEWHLTWEKIKSSEVFQRESKVCKLCMDEKMEIIKLMARTPQ